MNQHLHTQQQPSHFNPTIQQQQPQKQHSTSFQQPPNGQYERSSYLDALSDSPSLSFLTPHNEPFNPNSLLRDQTKSLALGPEDNVHYRSVSGYAAIQRPRPVQNGTSSFDDLHTPFGSHDIYSSQPPSQSQPPIGMDRYDVDQQIFGNTLRNNSMVVGNGPYGTGSTLPESQQVAVNKGQHSQLQHAMQQQAQQNEHAHIQQQQHEQLQAQLQAQQLATNGAPSLLPNLPGNLNTRDYLLALQQVQNAHSLGVMGLNNPALVSNLASLGGLAPTAPAAQTSQEEISTIFVVGFPDDMQEREFQNMFTFCKGFEAATLKVPNRETSAYAPTGNTAQQVAAAALRNFQASHGSNDPYNLLTTNSGGVVLDSRDLSSASVANLWNGLSGGASASADEAYRAALNLPAAADLGAVAPPAPRKQIIGFAKFRTRQDALDAREVLQGRRVDMEKGSMLKAEMAKKNLHTKRGVGPVSSSTAPSNPSASNTASLSMINTEALLAGLAAHQVNGLAGLAALHQAQQQQALAPEPLTQRDRDSAALVAMGLGQLSANRDREREREQVKEREKDIDAQNRARMGSMNLSAYDAFHSVPASASLPARPTTFPALPPSGSATLTPGITPALPPQNGYFDRHGLNGHQPLSAQSSFTTLNGGNDSPGNLWSSSFNASVDPLDTTGGLNPGSSAAPGGPTSTSSGLHPPSSSGTLSRKSSSLHGGNNSQNNSSPEQSAAFLSNTQSSSVSPISGSGVFDHSSQHSPAIPQGQPAAQTMYAVNGTTGHPLQSASSRDSAGSASPPEKYQSQASSFDSYVGSGQVNGLLDADLVRAMGSLAVGTHHELTSPQLPSPASGGSSGKANAADQNPPINTLYVGNLPSSNQAHPNALEEGLRQLFSRCPGYRKLCFRQKANGPMCFVEFDDVPCATKALNDLYGNNVGGLVKGGIRLSFSKNPLGVRTASVSAASSSLSASANLFTAALAGIQDSRFGQSHQLLPTRHPSLSAQSFSSAADPPIPRQSRQDSIDVLSPTSSFGSFGFNRSFSPPTFQQQPRPQASSHQPQTLSSLHSHPHSTSPGILEGLNNHFGMYVDTRDQHPSLATPTHLNPTVIPPSPQPGVEA